MIPSIHTNNYTKRQLTTTIGMYNLKIFINIIEYNTEIALL